MFQFELWMGAVRLPTHSESPDGSSSKHSHNTYWLSTFVYNTMGVCLQQLKLAWFIISAKWMEWNRRRLCFHFCVCVCVCVCARARTLSPIGLNGWNDVGLLYSTRAWKFGNIPYGQYIVGNIVLLTFWWYSQVQDQSGVEEKCTKMLTPFPMDFPHTPQHAVIIDDIIIIGRRLLRT